MLFPDGAVLAPQHHELSVATAQSGKVGDLHDHWSEHHKWNYCNNQDFSKEDKET